MVIWFTGLSGAGKTTLATSLQQHLEKNGYSCCLLDGDAIRKGLNKDLSFSDADRRENIRRVAEVARLMTDAGLIVLAAFVSPYEADRKMVRDIVGSEFIEVYVNCTLEVCEQRDTKGLYKKARSGQLKDLTGVGAPYEAPAHPNITIETGVLSIDESVRKLVDHVTSHLATEM